MKKILILIMLLAFLTPEAMGSWVFTSGDVVEITDDNIMNFPDANFSLTGWYKMTNNTGSDFRIWYQHHDWAAAGGHVVPRFYETSEGTYGDNIRLLLDDDDGTTVTDKATTGNVLNDTAWHHLAYIREGDTHKIYIDGVVDLTTAQPAVAAISPVGNAFFGQDGVDTTNQFLGNIAEVAFWTRMLTENEIDKLSGTNSETATSPSDISQTSIQWFWQMFDTLDTTSQTGSLTASHTGTAADSGEHPINYDAGPTSQVIHYYRSQQ